MEKLLDEVLIKTFEQVSFWEPERLKSFDESDLPKNPKICKISCLSPIKIDFIFISSYDTAQQLSDDINQNLFGAGEESIDDCIKEVMNILGGDFCINQFPEDDFELTIPEMLKSHNYKVESLTKYECDEGDFFFQIIR